MSRSAFRSRSSIPTELALGYVERIVQNGSRVWFTGEDGAAWCAREELVAEVPGARAPRCLFFESANAFRRVWLYPAEWLTCTRERLLELSQGR